MTIDDLLRAVICGEPGAIADLGLRLAERRPLPPCVEEPCAECRGQGDIRYTDGRYPCEACNGDGVRYVCSGCGCYRSDYTTPREEECRC